MTAAPFFDGTYQPSSASPSVVVKETSSYATPKWFAGTMARPTCVVTYARPTGSNTTSATTTPATARSARRA